MKLFSTLPPATKSLYHNILVVVCQPALKECLTILLLLLCTSVCFSEIIICKLVMVPRLNYFCSSKYFITYLYLKQYCIWGFMSSGMRVLCLWVNGSWLFEGSWCLYLQGSPIATLSYLRRLESSTTFLWEHPISEYYIWWWHVWHYWHTVVSSVKYLWIINK